MKEPLCDEQATLGGLAESFEAKIDPENSNNFVAMADSILIGMENKEAQTESFDINEVLMGRRVLLKCLAALKSMLKLCVESVN